MTISPFNAVLTGMVALAISTFALCAQPITVPNFSFESPSAAGFPFGANPSVDSWTKISEPAYYGPATGGTFPWTYTAGVFVDSNPYLNHDGTQAGYILSAPQVRLYQDYNSSPTHDFNATFEVGKSYNLTVGIFGKPSLAFGSTLQVSLYYRDGSDTRVVVGSTTAVFSLATFPTNAPLSLVDYQVNVPMVQASDAWAGQHIGIQLESTIPVELMTFGNWDFDNVRLSAVPEPASLSLLTVGVGALFLARSSSRRRS